MADEQFPSVDPSTQAMPLPQDVQSQAPAANPTQVQSLPQTEDKPSLPVNNGDDALNEFKVNSYLTLRDSSDFNAGIDALKNQFASTDQTGSAREILAQSGDALRFKFQENRPAPQELINMLPVKPADVPGNSSIEKINNYEKANLNFLNSTNDPDYVASSALLKQALQADTSEMRRDVLAGGEIQDKFSRFADAAVGPFTNLVGWHSVDDYLREHTKRADDRTLGSAITSGVGGIAPIIVGTLLLQPEIAGPATAAIIAAQSVATGKEVYDASIANTGDQTRAVTGGLLAAGAQGVLGEVLGGGAAAITETLIGGLLRGAGRDAAELTAETAANVATGAATAAEKAESGAMLDSMVSALKDQKENLGDYVLKVLKGATAAGGSQVLGNLANNIALNRDGDLTEGIGNAFLSGALIAGVSDGAKALWDNSVLNQHIKIIEEVKNQLKGTETPEENADPKLNPNGSMQGATFADGVWQESPANKAYENQPWTLREDGGVAPPERPEATINHRETEAQNINDLADRYINGEPSDPDKFVTDEEGNVVNPEYQADTLSTTIPKGTVVFADQHTPYENEIRGKDGSVLSSPARAMTYLAGKLGAYVELRQNVMNGAFGSAQGDGTIRLLRSLGADPDKFKSTIAHEFGHFIDFQLTQHYNPTSELGKTANRLVGLYDMITRASGGPNETDEMHSNFRDAMQLSADWRPGWDGSPGDSSPGASHTDRLAAYRAQPEEIYADVASAILNNPSYVRNEYPRLFSAFEGQLSQDPVLNQFWNQLRSFNSNPDAQAAFNLKVMGEARAKKSAIDAAEAQQNIQKNTLWNRLCKSAKLDYETIFKREGFERRKANALEGDEREKAFQQLDMVQRYAYMGDYLQTTFGSKLKSWLHDFRTSEIPVNTFAHIAWAENMQNSTTRAMKNIEESPALYYEAAHRIYDMLSAYSDRLSKSSGGTKGLTYLDKAFNWEKIKTPEDLQDALAKISLVADTGKMVSLTDYKVDPSTQEPLSPEDAVKKYNRNVAALNLRKRSIPMEFLDKAIEQEPDGPVKDAIREVIQPGAFAVRKYLMNAGGATKYDAANDLAYIKRSLGPQKYAQAESFLKSFHEILNQGNGLLRESGILTPEALDKIDLNKDYYVMANVLNHYQGSDSIDASIKRAVGSLSETGDEISSTASKMIKINAWAYLQRSINSAVDYARKTGHVVEEVPTERYQSVFDQKRKLDAQEPEHSHLVKYEDGVGKLYRIADNGTYNQMFKSIRTLPGFSTLLDVSDAVNDAFITRQFKTAFSPLFVATNKFRDRQKEAIFAGGLDSLFPIAGIFHTSPKLRGIDAQTKAEINHFLETREKTGVGELTGGLKEVVEKGVAMLRLHEKGDVGLANDGNFASGIAEAYGNPLPDERNRLEKIGNYTESALNKVGGDWLKSITDFDHLRSKVNGYQVGRQMLGMSDAEARVFSRENFGVPDALSGGTAAPLINRMFLFGRAHLNEMRVLGNFVKERPVDALTQTMLRVVMPKLLVMAPIMGYAMSKIFGQEDADKYTKLLARIPSFEKLSKNVIPIGFQDGKGNYHNFNDVRSKDIQADWKAWYIRLPQSRELTSLTKIVWPLISNVVEGHITKGIGGAVAGAGSDFVSSVQPSLQYLINAGQMSMGYNPTDFYRMRGIFNQTEQEGGSLIQKLGTYGNYALSQQVPLAGTYQAFNQKPGKNIGEDILKAPVLGPLARGFTGVSNYGLIEQGDENAAARTAETATLKLNMGDETQKALQLFASTKSSVTAVGGVKSGNVGADEHAESTALTSWQTRIYRPYLEEMRQAQAKGDGKLYNQLRDELEKSARSVMRPYEASKERASAPAETHSHQTDILQGTNSFD